MSVQPVKLMFVGSAVAGDLLKVAGASRLVAFIKVGAAEKARAATVRPGIVIFRP